MGGEEIVDGDSLSPAIDYPGAGLALPLPAAVVEGQEMAQSPAIDLLAVKTFDYLPVSGFFQDRT